MVTSHTLADANVCSMIESILFPIPQFEIVDIYTPNLGLAITVFD